MDTKYKILIVDDNKNNLFTLNSLLSTNKNCEVIEANSGYEALTKVLSQEINLIFLDIQMPEMNGFEVAKLLASKEATKNIPIIFLTAVFKDEEFKKEGYKSGAVDYLTKPIDDNLLLNKLNLYFQLFDREKKLKETIKELETQEAFVIQQSRLAAMGEMVSAIAHQWRQPLNIISLLVQDAQYDVEIDEFNKNKFNESVDKVLKQLDYMSDTIDDFRNFFKPNREKSYISPKKLIEEVLNIVNAQLKHNFIEVEKKCDGQSFKEDIFIYGYESELKQVILNLINNSKDAILERQKLEDKHIGKILIHKYSKNRKIYISISDNGIGISDENLPRIFEPYFSTKDKNGTGIGLYMSKTIIEEHLNGKIYAKKLNEGVKFTIEIDAKERDW